MEKINISEEQLRKIEEIILKYDPSVLFGGYIERGNITISVKHLSEDEVQVIGVMKILVNGDFDDDGKNPRWFESVSMYGPIFQRNKDEDGYDYWEYAIQWCDNSDYEILDMFVDIEWIESEV